jgi:hypothetical protein
MEARRRQRDLLTVCHLTRVGQEFGLAVAWKNGEDGLSQRVVRGAVLHPLGIFPECVSS